MKTVIDLLATMANDASLVSTQEINALLANADISAKQQQAILAQDSQELAETITNFPISMCGVILAPEDNEEQESQDESKNEEAKNTSNLVVNA